MTLVLFPLSAHLLPGGIMPLRIFEPRYQRMIAEVREREFALCMLDPRQPDAMRNMYPIATRVRIIDFDLLPDGLLGITVLGVERVRIVDLWQEPDGLRVGEVEGRLSAVGPRAVVLRALDGTEITIPHAANRTHLITVRHTSNHASPITTNNASPTTPCHSTLNPTLAADDITITT